MPPPTPEFDWRFAISLGIPTLIVVAGWFFAHWLAARRDLTSRKREARLKALEAAYMRLAKAGNTPLTDELMDGIELFVSELQLYGTPGQVALMQEIVEGFKKPNNPVPFDAILADIRNTIRAELELEPVTGGVWWFRFTRTKHGALPASDTASSSPGGSVTGPSAAAIHDDG